MPRACLLPRTTGPHFPTASHALLKRCVWRGAAMPQPLFLSHGHFHATYPHSIPLPSGGGRRPHATLSVAVVRDAVNTLLVCCGRGRTALRRLRQRLPAAFVLPCSAVTSARRLNIRCIAHTALPPPRSHMPRIFPTAFRKLPAWLTAAAVTGRRAVTCLRTLYAVRAGRRRLPRLLTTL